MTTISARLHLPSANTFLAGPIVPWARKDAGRMCGMARGLDLEVAEAVQLATGSQNEILVGRWFGHGFLSVTAGIDNSSRG